MTVKEINDYLQKHLWMDFEIIKIGANALELHGYIDESYGDCISIHFKDVYAVNLTTRFSYNGEGDFISVINDARACALNLEYGVTTGNKIFYFSNTNISARMFVIAKEIEVEVAA